MYKLMKFTAETGLKAERPAKLFDFALNNDSYPAEIAVFDTEEEALEALKGYKSSCAKVSVPAGSIYTIEAYAIEFGNNESCDYEPAEEI